MCHSCTLIEVPSPTRVAQAQAHIDALLAPFWITPTQQKKLSQSFGTWLPPITGPDSHFRNKAKMVVSGTTNEPTLGILDEHLGGVDLTNCQLYPEAIRTLIAALPAFIKRAQVPPYRVAQRRGELKHVLVTVGDADQLMLRFVLASKKPLDRIREHLPRLRGQFPNLAIVTANINPEHTAIIEGPEEIRLAGPETLLVTQGRVTLGVGPHSFLQTNTAVASGLYLQVSSWIDEFAHARETPLNVWDLFCGVGGFALHAAAVAEAPAAATRHAPRQVVGVEVAPAAVESARAAAARSGLDVDFVCADAARWATEQSEEWTSAGAGRPDVVIVNPPRRGMGVKMSTWVEQSGIPHVVYSSCNPDTLARDLQLMPSYRIEQARLLDMFPHTAHVECVCLLSRAK